MKKRNRFKDFIHNTSDLWIAFLIIAAAALLIGWRVSALINWPEGAISPVEAIQNILP